MRASGKARRRRHSIAIPRRRNAAGGAQARSNAIDISEAVHPDHHLFGDEETTAFAKAYFALRARSKDDGDQSELYRILDPVKQRFVDHLDQERQEQVRSDLNEFVRLYAFLSQIVTFSDAELERLYLFSRYLKRVLPVEREHLPREIQDQIDMESYGIRETASGSFTPERGSVGELDPRGPNDPRGMSEHEKERLSAIIQELNDRFGAGLTEKDRISLEHLESQLNGDASLQAAARSNTRENVRLTFEQRAKDQLQDMAASNFQLYKRIADDRKFGKALLDFLFEGFWRGRGNADQS
jgi:type I restriction enzyme, R subunit